MRIKKNLQGFFFHPFEIALYGKIDHKLFSFFSKRFKVGLTKEEEVVSQMQKADEMRDNDLLFLQGFKDTDIPKIIHLDSDPKERQKTICEIKEKKITHIIAIILSGQENEDLLQDFSCFKKDDFSSLTLFIQDYFFKLYPRKIYGLILSGGKSTRMKKDKGALTYFNKNQTEHTKELISSLCETVFISSRKEQEHEEFLKNKNQIHDIFPSVGPASGILSAMYTHPKVAWLVVACDLPYLTTETIKKLIDNRNPFKNATCYLNPTKNWPEPLCTIYEPKAYLKIHQFLAHGQPCPRKILFNSEISTLELEDKTALNNINTPEEYSKAKVYLALRENQHAD